MSELVEFLRARLDEDEQAARDADEARLFALSQSNHIVINDAGYLQHFTRDRALREVAAKRRIIALAQQAEDAANKVGDDYMMAEDYMTETLSFLALPYDDHESYREEWRV